MKFLSANEANNIARRTPDGVALLKAEIVDTLMESLSNDIHSAVVAQNEGIRLNIQSLEPKMSKIHQEAYTEAFDRLRDAGYEVTAILNAAGLASQAIIRWGNIKPANQPELF